MENHILTSETEQRLFQKLILPPIIAGENLTIMWVSDGGRRKTMLYLAQNAPRLGFKRLGKYLVCYIDHDELTDETAAAYFQLMLKSLGSNYSISKSRGQQNQEPFYVFKQVVENLVKKGLHLVFILGKFDEITLPTHFFNNLHNIWRIDKTKIHFIFAIVKNIFQEDISRQYGSLREIINQNLIYFPIHSPADASFLVEYLSRKYGYQISREKQLLGEKLGGGHPSLTKACLRILNTHSNLNKQPLVDFLNQQWEIKTILENIWESLNESEKNCLVLIAGGSQVKFSNIPDRLLQLGIVRQTDSKPWLFSALFESFIKSKGPKEPSLALDPQSGEILINGYPPKEKISLQEYHLLAAFLEKPKAIISRDKISEILWGKNSFEKYSDWAIDQIISQLRKKLGKLGVFSKNLQTIRGRGYRWLG